jgi:hypothetical protein
MEAVCESGFGYHMGGVLGSSIAKGVWDMGIRDWNDRTVLG